MNKSSSLCSDFADLTRSFFPPLSPNSYKGQSGKILVIGGSIEYTGAPYYAAISALRIGADLVHVFCPLSASAAIKSYSPDLIVHPLLDDQAKMDEMQRWLSKMHAVVVGPGLGSDEKVLCNVEALVTKIQSLKLPLIIDADGLRLVMKQPSLVMNHHKTIITPNKAEFERLCKTLDIQQQKIGDEDTATQEMASRLGNVTVIRKGRHDVVSDGFNTVRVEEEGSSRRAGGQGDVLAGFAATLSSWAHIIDVKNIGTVEEEQDVADLRTRLGTSVSACVAACVLLKRCAKNAFDRKGRAMITSDIIESIPPILDKLN